MNVPLMLLFRGNFLIRETTYYRQGQDRIGVRG